MKDGSSRELKWTQVATTFAMMLLLTAIGVRAGELPDVNLKIDRVALFKNGLGYFTSSATLPEGATTVRLGQVPVPSYGTFWVSHAEDVPVRSLYTKMENIDDFVPARNMFELFQANVGKKVTVGMGSGELPDIRGTIVSVLSEDKPPEAPSPYRMDIRRSLPPRQYSPYPAGQMVVISTDTGTVALSAGSIARVDIQDGDLTTLVPVVSRQPSIRMELERAAGGKTIEVSYLARGITWSPSYRIDISDPLMARLTAKAIVINEVADLHDVQLELITGFPNVMFSDVTSPVAMSQDLEGFLNALSAGRSESRSSGSLMQQQRASPQMYRVADEANASLPGYSTAREGSVSEDLFLYPVDGFTLARKETACKTLFSAEVPYKHIYTWKLPDALEENEQYRREPESDEDRSAEEVWHSCRLTNNMKLPWTTAVTEFIKDGQIAGQDTCYYTAPGTETTIRINRAMNILAEAVELETDRQRNAASFHGRAYDLVKVKGELSVHNRLDGSATLEVTKNLSGEVLETVPQAKDIVTARGLKRVNPRHVLLWLVELESGQRQSLSYQYEVYVRN